MKYWTLILSLLLGISSGFATEKEYADRLNQLKGNFAYQMVNGSGAQIDHLLQHKETAKWMGKLDYYHAKLGPVLQEEGVPQEMIFLAAALSRLNDTLFVAETGTAGIWQLPYRIATTYQLKVITLVDERRDAVKSTRAFARYAKELYKMYNDWYLVMAAYVSNPYQVNKAASELGETGMSYLTLEPGLPAEVHMATRDFTAFLYLFHYRNLHKINTKPHLTVQRDSVMADFAFSFSQVERCLGVKLDSMRAMNPEFRYSYVPLGLQPYRIALPIGMAKRWNWFKDTIVSMPTSPLNLEPYRIEKDTGSAGNASAASPAKTKLYYTVRSGDNSTHIADLYDCTYNDLKRWNPRVNWRYLKIGQKIVVYVPTERKTYYSRINVMSAAQKKQIKNKD